MELTGKIHRIYAPREVSDTFKKRDFVIAHADNPMYPQYSIFQVTQDKCELLDGLMEGQTVKIAFNLRGRSWTPPSGGDEKFFNTLEAWRIEALEESATAPAHPPAQQQPQPVVAGGPPVNDDDLPF